MYANGSSSRWVFIDVDGRYGGSKDCQLLLENFNNEQWYVCVVSEYYMENITTFY